METVILFRWVLFGGLALLVVFSGLLHLFANLRRRLLLRSFTLLLTVVYLAFLSYFFLARLDLPQGEVTGLEISDGVYTGVVKDGLPHGKGVLIYASDGSEISGEFVNGKANGQGTIFFADGSFYEGQLKDNQMSGEGKLRLTNKDGQTTEVAGSFESGILGGIGTILYDDGSFYEGEIHNLRPCGQGILTFADGSVYEGGFSSGAFHGTGKFTCKSCGHVYEGNFVCGLMDGEGSLLYQKETYSGVWHRDSLGNRLFWCSSPYYQANKLLALGKPFVESVPDFFS